MDTETLMLRGIPARLKGKIKRAVEEDKSNMNDVLVQILADVYSIPFEPTGVQRIPVGSSPQALLTVPTELKRQIAIDAAAQGTTIRNVVMKLIAEAFGETFKPTGRWASRGRRTLAKT